MAASASAGVAEPFGRRVGEQRCRRRAARPASGTPSACDAGGVAVDEEQPDRAVRRPRGDDQVVGAVAAEHGDLLPAQRPRRRRPASLPSRCRSATSASAGSA